MTPYFIGYIIGRTVFVFILAWAAVAGFEKIQHTKVAKRGWKIFGIGLAILLLSFLGVIASK